MPDYEYRYETIGSNIRPVHTADRERVANEDLARLAAVGWEPISVTRPDVLSSIGCPLRRPAN
ncbi:hypothetical protein GCM10009840_18120 [Pseudolysinimonas kribbensis]|uniref:DUF4177 domain-containing protein n=1 Tax=Pseudolysinimonas kribbensis TaxID=433641 RepID=A0ABQ6K405_9MICO|nr:hypothetical protein GCM10025881_06290 [Pseudolysinimonas kribbensis]